MKPTAAPATKPAIPGPGNPATKAKATAKPKPKKPSPPKPKAEKPAVEPKREEVDVSKLAPEETAKRVGKIYDLERKVETKRKAYDLANRARKVAKTELTEAEEALEQEIQDQRYGPGPLFNPKGDGPAKQPAPPAPPAPLAPVPAPPTAPPAPAVKA